MLLADIKSLITVVYPVFIGSMPDDPDNCICIYSSGGRSPMYKLSGNPVVSRPSIQIKVRSNSYKEGFETIEGIKNDISGLGNLTVDQSKILSITQIGDVMQLGQDEKRRSSFTINFSIQIADS